MEKGGTEYTLTGATILAEVDLQSQLLSSWSAMNLKYKFCKENLCQEKKWTTSSDCSRIILQVQIRIISLSRIHA